MTSALFSVSFAGLWGQAQLSLTDFIARAGSLGYSSVMVMAKRPHLSPLDASGEAVTAIREALRAASVKCAVVAAYTNLSAGSAPEVPLIEFQIAYVESLARLASQLGASIVRVFTAYETGDPRKDWRDLKGALREICDRAAAYGVTIAVQNHHDVALETDELLDLLVSVGRPNCKLGFDAWSPALRGEDLYESARKAAAHAVLTTNADYCRSPRYRYLPSLVNYERLFPDLVRAVPFGEGFIDYRGFFQGLRDGGFDGLAVYEICSPVRGGGSLANLDAFSKRYLEWMHANKLLEPGEARSSEASSG